MSKVKIKILQFVGLFSLTYYTVWNIYFITNKEIPVSILYKLTGIPSPTTGMYRSITGLIHLDFGTFLENNPAVILFLFALMVVGIDLTYKSYKKEKIVLNNKSTYFLIFCLILGELTSINNYLL